MGNTILSIRTPHLHRIFEDPVGADIDFSHLLGVSHRQGDGWEISSSFSRRLFNFSMLIHQFFGFKQKEILLPNDCPEQSGSGLVMESNNDRGGWQLL